MVQFVTFLVLIGAFARIVICDDNSDDRSELCKSGKDLACVRKYFGEHAQCSVVDAIGESPLYEMNVPLFIPVSKITGVALKMCLPNLDGEIEEFYLNKTSGNIVISVNFKSLSVYAPEILLAFSQKGREPKVIKDYAKATYSVILTAVIPVSNGITAQAMKEATYFAYMPHNSPNVQIGPKLRESKDPDILFPLRTFYANLKTGVQEIFGTKASFDFLVFLQNYICDFGLHPMFGHYDSTVFLNIENMDHDDDAEYFEPCAGRDDVRNCVSSYFEELGSCSVVRQPSDEPVTRSKAMISVPLINSTLVPIDSQLTGLDGEIEKFYINKQSGNLVMSINFEGIKMDSPVTYLLIDQVGKQPRIISDHNIAIYPMTLTAVIPISEGLTSAAIKTSFVFADPSQPATFQLGPNFMDDKDEVINKAFAVLSSDPLTITREILASEATSFFIAFLQKYICDYGLPLTPYE